jgi:hypothetical protein
VKSSAYFIISNSYLLNPVGEASRVKSDPKLTGEETGTINGAIVSVVGLAVIPNECTIIGCSYTRIYSSLSENAKDFGGVEKYCIACQSPVANL